MLHTIIIKTRFFFFFFFYMFLFSIIFLHISSFSALLFHLNSLNIWRVNEVMLLLICCFAGWCKILLQEIMREREEGGGDRLRGRDYYNIYCIYDYNLFLIYEMIKRREAVGGRGQEILPLCPDQKRKWRGVKGSTESSIAIAANWIEFNWMAITSRYGYCCTQKTRQLQWKRRQVIALSLP